MNLYIQQQIFTWGDKFTVYDENGNEKYYVEGEVFTFGKKLHIYDLAGNELVYIEQQLLTFQPRYTIYINGSAYADVIKEFTFFHQEYTVSGPDWHVHGDFFDHDYDIISANDTCIASISKQWFTLGDAYEIAVKNNEDAVCALAVVLIIDACIDAQRN
ncbi:MAG: LURP-one-related family protein [Clostridia bacterium]|nr:LURP-one-related family protein [Clostridia bacterium]